jgi:carbon storage regulator
MLVLSRRLGERICFPSLAVHVQILAIHGASVRIGIDAPEEVRVLRAELCDVFSPDHAAMPALSSSADNS